jgi:hypothetical protein
MRGGRRNGEACVLLADPVDTRATRQTAQVACPARAANGFEVVARVPGTADWLVPSSSLVRAVNGWRSRFASVDQGAHLESRPNLYCDYETCQIQQEFEPAGS